MPSNAVAAPPAQQRSSLGRQASAWIPVAVCILVIACESTVYFGADHTSGPLQRFVEWLLNRHFTQNQWWALHLKIRKVGHFTGYGILSVAWFRAFWMTWSPASDRRLATHGLAMLGTFFVASCDEFHQLFLPNRTGSFYDVLIDCSGGLLLQLIVWLWFTMRKPA